MIEAINFIEFCEMDKNEDILYHYLRWFFMNNDYFFNQLFESFCDENDITNLQNKCELQTWCKFYANNYFGDIAIDYQDEKKNSHY